jgi:DNA-binding NtrC family response regulator
MAKIPILLIEDDPKVTSQIEEALHDHFEVLAFEKMDGFLHAAKDKPRCVAIIDFDLKETDGILAFKKLKEINPHARAIMISSANNIPLAVSAAKLGILEFLRKPLLTSDFTRIVEKLAKKEDIPKFSYNGIPNTEWLKGVSPKILEFEKNIIKYSAQAKDLVLLAERGIDKKTVVRLIHQNGLNSAKKLTGLDLSSFAKESLEGHFWATLNELLSIPGMESVKKEEEQTGLIFIEGFEVISDHFRASVFDFIKNRSSKPNFNPEVQVVIGLCDDSYREHLTGFEQLFVPSLRERKEDLPAIMAEYLKNKTNCSAVSYDVLEFISLYDFPGNYDELENMIKAACVEGEVMSGFNFNRDAFISYLKPQTVLNSLNSLRDKFEKKFIGQLLKKTKRDIHAVARFLNVPKTVLDERVRELDL